MLVVQRWEVESEVLSPSSKARPLLYQGKALYRAFLSLARSFLKDPSGWWLRRNVSSLIALKTAYSYLLSALEEADATPTPKTETADPLITKVIKLNTAVKRKGLLEFALKAGLEEGFWKDLEETTAIVSFLLNVLLAIREGRVKVSQKIYKRVRRLLRRYLNRLEDLWLDVDMLRYMVGDRDTQLVDIDEVEGEIEKILEEKAGTGEYQTFEGEGWQVLQYPTWTSLATWD